MKNLFISFAVFFFLLVIGCQENLMIDPATTESFNKDASQNSAGSNGTIILHKLLLDPSQGFNSLLLLNGIVTYEQHIVFPPLPPEYEVSVFLSKEAQLQDPFTKQVWNIKGKKDYRIYLAPGGEYVLEDHCIVSDRIDGLALVCRYLITTSSLILEQTSLVLENQQNINNSGGAE